jgi:hypothetical protein
MKANLDTQFQKFGDDYDKAVNEIDAKFAAEAQINSLRQKYAINETMSAEDVGKLNDVISRIEADYGPESAQRLKDMAASLTVDKGPDQRGKTDNERSADGIAVLKGFVASFGSHMTGKSSDEIQNVLRRTLADAGIINTEEQDNILKKYNDENKISPVPQKPIPLVGLSDTDRNAKSLAKANANGPNLGTQAQFGSTGEILTALNAAAKAFLAGMQAGMTVNNIDNSTKTSAAVQKTDSHMSTKMPEVSDYYDDRALRLSRM